MNKRLITLVCFCALIGFISGSVSADSVKPVLGQMDDAKTAKPKTTKEKQQEYQDAYNKAKWDGPKALDDLINDTVQNGTQEENKWLVSLKDDKNADGSKKDNKQKAKEEQKEKEYKAKPKGFNGDPNDPGPTDWSNWNVKTDGKGNVTGFEEKDFDQKDKDGDGKISDKEREEWNKKKEEEDKKNGGAPGDVDITPEWDKDNDGKPDPGFMLDCWQCKKGQDGPMNECHNGRPGNCDNGGSCEISEVCHPADEVHDGKTYQCHTCEYKNDQPQWCREKGFSDSPNCDGKCPVAACFTVDIDIRTGEKVRRDRTRERGATRPCYTCMQIDSIEVTWYIYIIETPWGRYVLDKNKNSIPGFNASQVMSLVQAGPNGGIAQLAGMFGGPLGGILSGGGLSFGNISGLLTQGLQKGGKYTDDCFEKDFSQTKFPDTEAPQDDSVKKKKDEKNANSIQEAPGFKPDPGAEYGIDPNEAIIPDGPMIACGMMGKEKALLIMNSLGQPIETIVQSQLEQNPNAVAQALAKAGETGHLVREVAQGNFQSLINRAADKITKLVSNKIEQKISESKAQTFVPNDPFYQAPVKKKKKKLLGILGGDAPKNVSMGLGMKMGMGTLGAPSTPTKKKLEVKHQWGLHEIGYLPEGDPDSAWNFVDEDAKNVLVAVIDSGYDFNHPDSAQYTWTNENEIPDNGIDDDHNGYIDDIKGWNYLDNNNDLTDGRGHGSFVAGIIAAKKNNGIGIAGINPGAVIMPIKVADKKGETNSLHITRAVYYAVENGAQVINISLGARGVSQLERGALRYAKAKGIFVAVAAGNIGENIGESGPASADGVFSVGSIDFDGERSTISNWGANNGLLAPGEEIISLIAGGTGDELAKSLQKQGYYPQSGTSFSTPMVTGTASLLLAQNPHLTNFEIEDILTRTADDMYEPGWDSLSGAGLLNATAALSEDVNDRLTVRLDELKVNKDKKDILSVDVYGTVRGEFKTFVVEIAKGKYSDKFKQVAGPFKTQATHNWLTRLSKDESLRGSNEWQIRIVVIDQKGTEYIAHALLTLE